MSYYRSIQERCRRLGLIAFSICIAGMAVTVVADQRRAHGFVLLGMTLVVIGGFVYVVHLVVQKLPVRRRNPALIVVPAGDRPPTAVACPECGGAAPIRLAEPSHATCRFCGTRFALPQDVARRVAIGAEALRRSDQATRQLSAGGLSGFDRAQWLTRIKRISYGLGGGSAVIALFYLGSRVLDNDIHGRSFGERDVEQLVALIAVLGSGVIVALIAGWSACLLVPLLLRRGTRGLGAIRSAGTDDLDCRACGGALAKASAAVARCASCGADNLTSDEALRDMADALYLLEASVAEDRRRAELLATASIHFLPFAICLLGIGWLVAVGLVLTMHLPTDPHARFAVVRVTPYRGADYATECVAQVKRHGARYALYFYEDEPIYLSAAELGRVADETDLPPRKLLGRRAGSGDGSDVVEVYTTLTDSRHHGKYAGGTVVVPNRDGIGGSLFCFGRTSMASLPTLHAKGR